VRLLLQEERRLLRLKGDQDREGIAFHLKTKGPRKIEETKGEPKKELICYNVTKRKFREFSENNLHCFIVKTV
jgi:hypothetical protein